MQVIKNNLYLTGYCLRLWRQNALCCIVKVLSKHKTLNKFAFNCLLFYGSLFCSAPSNHLLYVCLSQHTLEEHSSNSSSCVRGDTGSRWYCSAGVRGFSVRERAPGRPCSIGLRFPFWLPLFHHCGCGIASRYCRSTTCCRYPVLENHAATARRPYMAEDLATPGIIPRCDPFSKVKERFPVYKGESNAIPTYLLACL